MTANTVAIVDAYSSGALLPAEFRKFGCACVMVQSLKPVPAIYQPSFRPDDFAEVIAFRGDLQETAARLRGLGVGVVLAGCEAGVILADRLSEGLGLASNGVRLSAARRNKYLMAQVLRRRGLRTPAQFGAPRLPDLLAWVRRRNAWPVVLKPLASAANDGVFVCFDEEEVRAGFRNISNQWNALGLLNAAVLAQEFVTGTEYVVDTVSCAGRHRAAAFWRYTKPPAEVFAVGYNGMELLPAEGDVQHVLFDYVCQVLDALEVRYGPAHCEVMWDAEGPVLLEVGARMNGGNSPLICRLATGHCQAGLTVDCYLHPEHFLHQLGHPYTLEQHATLVFLTPAPHRRLVSVPGAADLNRLVSVQDLFVADPWGDWTPRVVGWVVLAHGDKSVVDADVAQIREWERDGLYQYAD